MDNRNKANMISDNREFRGNRHTEFGDMEKEIECFDKMLNL